MKRIHLFLPCIILLLLLVACASGNLKNNSALSETGATNSADEAEVTNATEQQVELGQLSLIPDNIDDPFDSLLEADVGQKIKTGITSSIPNDNWYKFDEDDDNIYLLYGDYYPARWLKNLDRGTAYYNKLIVLGTYDVGTQKSSGSDSRRIVEYIQDESSWDNIASAFEAIYPYRNITAYGSPTKDQVESVAEKYYIGEMLRPHTDIDGYGGCMGYWLGTEDSSGTVFGVRGLDYLALIDSNWASNGYAFRPIVTISKQEREKTEAESASDQLKATVISRLGQAETWEDTCRIFILDEVYQLVNFPYEAPPYQYAEFALHDFNYDGIPELLFSTGYTNMAVCSAVDGDVRLFGTIINHGESGIYAAPDSSFHGLIQQTYGARGVISDYWDIGDGELHNDTIMYTAFEEDESGEFTATDERITQNDALYNLLAGTESDSPSDILREIKFCTKEEIESMGWESFIESFN